MKIYLTFPELEHPFEKYIKKVVRNKQVLVIERYSRWIGGRATNPESCAHYMNRYLQKAKKIHTDYLITTYDYDMEKYLYNQHLSYKLIYPTLENQQRYFDLLYSLGYNKEYIKSFKENWQSYLCADRGEIQKEVTPVVTSSAIFQGQYV